MKLRKCVICLESKNGFRDHHIKPKRYGGSDREENRIIMCSSCHGKLHQFYCDLALILVNNNISSFFEVCYILFSHFNALGKIDANAVLAIAKEHYLKNSKDYNE